MKYQATITVKGGTELLRAFEAEYPAHKADRSSYSIKKNKGSLVFSITAMDAVALRATLNSITKLLDVFDRLP